MPPDSAQLPGGSPPPRGHFATDELLELLSPRERPSALDAGEGLWEENAADDFLESQSTRHAIVRQATYLGVGPQDLLENQPPRHATVNEGDGIGSPSFLFTKETNEK